jgi:hypothetical protein
MNLQRHTIFLELQSRRGGPSWKVAEMNINPTGEIAEDAASFARSLVEAKIHEDDAFFNLVWGQLRLSEGFVGAPGEDSRALEERIRWQACLIASLTMIATAGILVATKDPADEVDKEAALRFLRRMGKMGLTF